MLTANDVTERLTSDLRDYLCRVKRVPGTKPINRLTAGHRKLMDHLEGTRLAPVSTALVYGCPVVRGLTATRRRTLLGLLLGGHLRVYKTYGALAVKSSSADTSDAAYHYVIRTLPLPVADALREITTEDLDQ